MAGMTCSDDDDAMMYYAELLLDLPKLVYMSEFKNAWKQGNWNSTKKRSDRKIRRVVVDFNCRSSLIARLGTSSNCCVSCGTNNNSAKKKRKRTNPNPSPNWVNTEFKKRKLPTPTPTTTLLKVKFKLSRPLSLNGYTDKDSSPSSSGSGSGVFNEGLLNAGGGDGTAAVGKKRKKKKNLSPSALTKTTSESELPPPAKKHKSSSKVTFNLSDHNGHTHTNVVGHKDSSICSGSRASNEDLLSVAGNAADHSEPSSSLVLVDNNNAVDTDINKPLIPDLNIPITMTEEPLLDHLAPSRLLLLPAADVPMQTQAAAQPPMLLQNNNNNRNINDRAAAAKEKRMMRMQKLKQRRMTCG